MASFKDLGVERAEVNHYADHIVKVSSDCRRLAGAVMRIFRSRNPSLMWDAFQIYVKSKAMYACCVWSPVWRYEFEAIEKIQRRFTKWLLGLADLSYVQRLRALDTLSLEQTMQAATVIFVFKCLLKLHDCSLSDVGIFLSPNNERSGKIRMCQPRCRNAKARAMFKFRAPREWNQLPADITSLTSITKFKAAVHKHYSNFNI